MEMEAARLIAAGVCMGIGSFGPAVAEGYVAGKAMEAIGRSPDVGSQISPLMITAMAICESTGIYALIISLLILFVA
jgi:F-type H+-transporting ATPase subunit c